MQYIDTYVLYVFLYMYVCICLYTLHICACMSLNQITDQRNCITWGTWTKARHRAARFLLQSSFSLLQGNTVPRNIFCFQAFWKHSTTVAPEKHTDSEKQSLCIVLEEKRAGKRARMKACLFLSSRERNWEVKTGGQWAYCSYGLYDWSSPGEEGLEGEGAVFFFCPNNLIKFVSTASGIEISSRYTVCLCLINVNLPRALTMPQAVWCLALH